MNVFVTMLPFAVYLRTIAILLDHPTVGNGYTFLDLLPEEPGFQRRLIEPDFSELGTVPRRVIPVADCPRRGSQERFAVYECHPTIYLYFP